MGVNSRRFTDAEDLPPEVRQRNAKIKSERRKRAKARRRARAAERRMGRS